MEVRCKFNLIETYQAKSQVLLMPLLCHQFIEFIGETALCYLSGMIDIVIGNFHTTQPAAYVGITNVFLISLFIFAMAPASGGHVNPVITFATMTAGLTGFSRGIPYLIAQTAGAASAGALIRGSLGGKLAAA